MNHPRLITFTIPFVLPDLNEFLQLSSMKRRRVDGYRMEAGSLYTGAKKKMQKQVEAFAAISLRRTYGGLPKLPRNAAAIIRFDWREPSRRRDPDNLAAGGTKIILDALKSLGVIQTDGWSLYERSTNAVLLHAFHVHQSMPGVTVTIEYEASDEGEQHDCRRGR
jgi:hypothetical protein